MKNDFGAAKSKNSALENTVNLLNDNLNETLLENESNKKEINNLENTLVIFEQKAVETAKVIENLEKKLAKGTEAQKSLMKSLEE